MNVQLSFISTLIGSSLQCVSLDNFPSLPHCYNLRYLMLHLKNFSPTGAMRTPNQCSLGSIMQRWWILSKSVTQSAQAATFFTDWRPKNSRIFSLTSFHKFPFTIYVDLSTEKNLPYEGANVHVLHNKLTLSYANKFGEYVLPFVQ